MGILGSLLYPDNTQMAEELNKKDDQLRRQNNLHNGLVNSYRLIGEKTKTFDGYLMALIAMHYHLTYTEEDLANLPDTDLPKTSQSIVDNIEEGVLDILTVKMAVDGIKAIRNGIANLVPESGIFTRAAPSGEAAISESLGASFELESLSLTMVNSGSVSLLTTESADEVSELSAEVGSLARSVSETVESVEVSEASVGIREAGEVAQSASAAAESGAAAAESGAAAAGAAAILGPVLLIGLVVSEIISTIDARNNHAKLKAAEARMDELLTQSAKSLKDMKATFTCLLNAAKTDIEAYNKLLPNLYAISKDEALNRQPFSTRGIETFIADMDRITIDSDGTPGYEAGALTNLNDAQQFLATHAVATSQAAEVVKQLKTHMAKQKPPLTDISDDDQYLQVIAEANSTDLKIVVEYNIFRRNIATIASMLKPYHDEVTANASAGAKPAKPLTVAKAGQPNPNFIPRPSDFKIPMVVRA